MVMVLVVVLLMMLFVAFFVVSAFVAEAFVMEPFVVTVFAEFVPVSVPVALDDHLVIGVAGHHGIVFLHIVTSVLVAACHEAAERDHTQRNERGSQSVSSHDSLLHKTDGHEVRGSEALRDAPPVAAI